MWQQQSLMQFFINVISRKKRELKKIEKNSRRDYKKRIKKRL